MFFVSRWALLTGSFCLPYNLKHKMPARIRVTLRQTASEHTFIGSRELKEYTGLLLRLLASGKYVYMTQDDVEDIFDYDVSVYLELENATRDVLRTSPVEIRVISPDTEMPVRIITRSGSCYEIIYTQQTVPTKDAPFTG